jgi:hypothetical protein
VELGLVDVSPVAAQRAAKLPYRLTVSGPLPQLAARVAGHGLGRAQRSLRSKNVAMIQVSGITAMP